MAAAASTTPQTQPAELSSMLKEWSKDHAMFASTLEELAGQLAGLEPPQPRDSGPGARRSSSGGSQAPSADVLRRVMDRAPDAGLRAYIDGTLGTARMQRQLPELLDQNLRLLGILAAEMRGFVRRVEHLVDAAAAAVAQPASGDGTGGVSDDEALLMAATVEGLARETAVIEKAAEGITLTTPPDQVAAAATIIQLQPFVDSTLLAALLQEATVPGKPQC